MKKTTYILALGAVCVSILSGCKSKNKYKIPTNAHDKVAVAFDGVERSFANYKKTNTRSVVNEDISKSRAGKRVVSSDTSGALSDIGDLYKSYDQMNTSIEELEYNQSPMIQFQSVKRVFDAIGNDYVFGTKYSDSITGSVYFDNASGDKKDVDPAYKYDYTFTVSLLIEIDNNDLINGDVAFKIDLSQGETNLQTNWYTTFTLSYDMSKQSPNYTLSMYSDNEEDDLEYLDYGNTYEYDLIEMKDGRINEWRKFCYEVNKRMVKDATHTSFADYVVEPDFRSQIGASQWYKNAILSEITHPTTSKTNKFIAALFDKLGLNTTDINAETFLDKESVSHSVIRQVYQDLSKNLGQELVYNLIINDEGHKQQIVRKSISILDDELKPVSQITLQKDTTFRELFNGEQGNYGIWYFNENGEVLELVENLNTIKFLFRIPYASNIDPDAFDNSHLDMKISEMYKQLTRKNYEERMTADITIFDTKYILKTQPVSIDLGKEFEGELDTYFKHIFPADVLDLGFPEYESAAGLFEFGSGREPYLDISQTTQAELDAFDAKLVGNSAEGNWTKEVISGANHYSKLVNHTLYVMEVDSSKIADKVVRIYYNVTQIDDVSWPTSQELKDASDNVFDFAAPASLNGYFVTDPQKEGTIILKNFTQTEKDAFIETLNNVGEKRNIRDNSIFILKDNHIYEFGLVYNGNDIEFTYKTIQVLDVYQIVIERDGAEPLNFTLDNNLTGYFYKEEFETGIYKVKKVNLSTSESSYLAINGTTLDCYIGKIAYDEEEKELEVLEKTMLDFSMTISEENIELLDLRN